MTAMVASPGRGFAAWVFGALLVATAVANLAWVHPVPAVGYLVASLLYLPPATASLRRRSGIRIHPVFQVGLGIAIVMFTLGVSDLGDMLDGGLG